MTTAEDRDAPARTLEELAAEIEAGEAKAEAALAEAAEAAERAAETIEAELEALRAERDELHDRLLRALAEAENTRRRAERDRREAAQYGGSRLARDLLPVYDSLKKALEAAGKAERTASPALIEGVELTLKELLNVLGRHGVTVVAPEVGERFDPNLHQAMFEAPVPGTRAGEIIQVMSDGFLMHERLLRPAHVGVSSMPEGTPSETGKA